MATAVYPVARNQAYTGNDKLLLGIIMGTLGFWLFAQTTLNIFPIMAADLGIETSVMNIAVSITALFSGIFIVVIGGLADRFGRVRMVMLGRILQGFSGAFIMPASLALIKAYWDGAECQRAIGFISMGTWGGSGFAAFVVLVIISIKMTIPERKAEEGETIIQTEVPTKDPDAGLGRRGVDVAAHRAADA